MDLFFIELVPNQYLIYVGDKELVADFNGILGSIKSCDFESLMRREWIHVACFVFGYLALMLRFYFL